VSPRAEGPSVSSPARQGGVFKTPLTRGPKDRHSGCVAPSALLLNARLNPGLTAGPTLYRPFGPQLPKYINVIANSSTKADSVISIVIVNWNSGFLLEKCVRSLMAHAPGCELVVVDNASSDSSLDFAAKLAALGILKNNENLGYAAANNQGWRHSRGDHVLFLNPDTEAKPGAVDRLARALTADPARWASAGKLIDSSGATQVGFNIRSFPTAASVAADMLMLDEIWPANPWTCRYRMSHADHDAPKEVDQPAAACLMVRRAALERLGGFDESYRPAWFEDVDLCRRIWSLGGRIVFEPGAEFVHYGGSSLRRLTPREFLLYFHTNQLRYFYKHHGDAYGMRIRRLVIAGMYLRSVASLLIPLLPHSTRASSATTFWQTARHFALNREAGR
jgi:N-acetylglucosaminyl-diphospho-decaprenol L-rhamnosyltransferase